MLRVGDGDYKGVGPRHGVAGGLRGGRSALGTGSASILSGRQPEDPSVSGGWCETSEEESEEISGARRLVSTEALGCLVTQPLPFLGDVVH